jgi:2-amino-4-hydroxy-6-hydroxymethyldihydropteridine diphosphokinase
VPLARIGLGSNIGDAAQNVERALLALERLGRVVARSALYRTKPWGVREQADFVNAAALLETPLGPRPLLEHLQALERELGRVPAARWGPRAIDLDILAYDDLTLAEDGLAIPHPRLRERAFALVPLAEIDPAFRPARDALDSGDRRDVQRIPSSAARRPTTVNWDETLERVRSAAEFCASAGLARFRIEEDDLAVEVRRPVRAPRAAAAPSQPTEAARSNGFHVSSNGATLPAERAKTVLKAEFVGIVRFSRPSVAAGTVVAEDRELAYVEALGIRNPVRSGGAGRVAGVFVTDGQAVEYGQPLFSLET